MSSHFLFMYGLGLGRSEMWVKILSEGTVRQMDWRRKFASAEVVAQRCSVEKVVLEISQNSQENTCARDPFLIKLQFSKIESLA